MVAAAVATATVARGARAVARLTRTRDFGLRVGNAVNRNALEVVLVELLNSRLEIGSSLVLDKAFAARASGVALAVDLAVDDVKARLASEVLQVLRCGVSWCT